MLDEIIRNTIRDGATEQLHTAFGGLAKAMSLRSAKGLATDRSLNETVSEIMAETSARGNRRRPA